MAMVQQQKLQLFSKLLVKVLKYFLIGIISLVIIICSIYIVAIVEALTLKESWGKSVGNCRIVNIIEGINKNLELRFYYYDKVAQNGTHLRHVIAVDSNNKIVDKSDLRPDENGVIPESLDGKDLSFFEKRDKNTPHLEYIYSKEHKGDIINEISDTYYFIGYIRVFSFAYKIFH